MLSTSKLTSSIDREVRTLVASLDDCAARLIAGYPDAGMTVRKIPDRLILQAGDVGVSISLFRSRAGMEAGAEVIVSLWQGEVTMPGSSSREGHRAQPVSTQQFRITACGDAWLWSDAVTTAAMTSRDLAAACIQTMVEQLSPVTLNRQNAQTSATQ